VAGLIAYGLFRWRMWRAGRGFNLNPFPAGSFSRHGSPFRR
jgi:hypothetical protein